MTEFLNGLEKSFREKADHIALCGEDAPQGYTYRELDENSGRVYSYLKERGIGREDIVLICLPRSTRVFTAMLGVWKAGAAFVICEDSMPPERIAYIRADSGCKLFLDLAVWEETMLQPTLPGRETVDAHDLAYLVYTSGSTGTPKGVMHEYGALDYAIRAKQMNGKPLLTEDDVIAINSPLNFTTAENTGSNTFYRGAKLQVVPTAVVKNPQALARYYEDAGVTAAFMAVSLYRACGEMNSQMRLLSLGGEGCSMVYSDRIRLLNGYNMSEAGREICLFEIDQAYDITPIGKNQGGEEIHLLKEDGTEAAVGELGEICFANPYMRGYINQPEKTAEALRGGLFHSGDLAIRDENGNLTIHGRMDDMVKINGNRVDPSEIEAAAKDILQLNWCAAKAFVEEKRSYICFYYTDEQVLDEEKLRAELIKRLPDYMIPAYYIRLDSVPTLASGKMDRSALPKPDASDFAVEYVAPETETQKIICEAVAKALNLERVGIKDDFYKIGGDSLTSMEAMMYANLPDLTVNEILAGRTVEKIAEIYDRKDKMEVSFEELEREAEKHDWPLLKFMSGYLDIQFYSPSKRMVNQRIIYRIPKENVDPERLCAAVNTVLERYSIFSTVLVFNDENEFVQRYMPSKRRKVVIEEMPEAEFCEADYNKTYRLFGETLADFHLVVTEQYIYLMDQQQHMITDASCVKMVADRIVAAYYDEPLPPDTYFAAVKQMQEEEQSADYEQAMKYHYETYLSKEWCSDLPPDGHTRENVGDTVMLMHPFTLGQMDVACNRLEATRTMLSLSAMLLTLSKMTGKKDVLTAWSYVNRENMLTRIAIGQMVHSIPLGISLDEIATVDDLFQEMKIKSDEGRKYKDYQWIVEYTNPFEREVLTLAYKSDFVDLGRIVEWGVEQVRCTENDTWPTNMCMVGMEKGEYFISMILYRIGYYKRETIEKFGEIYSSILNTLVHEEKAGSILIEDLLKD